MPEVIRASTAGFCMGVGLALKKLDGLLQEQEARQRGIYTLGPIIHNPQVQGKYEEKGVRQVQRAEDVPPNSYVVIRAHGVPRKLRTQLQERGARIVDATCPKVHKAQKLIETHTQGRTLLLYGEPDHPEVIGLVSYAQGKTVVFESYSQLEITALPQGKNFVLAAQTTQDRWEYNRLLDYLKQHLGFDLPVLDTICDTTRQRQYEAAEITEEVDLMIVVGGYRSGNTRRLVQVVRDRNKPCIHVESAAEVPLERVRSCARIGLTAGASTPCEAIEEVERVLDSAS